MQNERLIPSNGKPSVVTQIIRVEGEEIPLTYQVLSMAVSKEINRIPFAKLVIKDGDPALEDFPISNDTLFEPGKELEVLVGYEANEDLIFKGIIVKMGIKIRMDGSSMLCLDCRDKAFKTTLVPNNRYFTEVKDSDVLEEILGNYDLETEISSTEVTHQDLLQYETSDWDFVLQRAEANGLICLTDDGQINLKKPELDQDPLFPVAFGASMLDFDGQIDARLQYTKVLASSWDPASQELLEVEAVEPGLQEAGNLSASDLAEAVDDPELKLRHTGQLLQDELQAMADSELLKVRLAKIQGRVKFQGTAIIKPGSLIELQGLGDRFNGPVFASGIRHEITGGTWQTDVQFGLPEKAVKHSPVNHKNAVENSKQNITGLQIGVVTQLQDDPDGEHRILLRLPMIDDTAEGSWARMATLDAGETRGTFFLPEVGDEVVVGFLHGDAHDPVVLGMLNSSSKTAPIEASDENHEKGFVSRSGIKLIFNDDKTSITIETPAGKKILCDEDQGEILLEDENNNKIVMDSNGILIESGGNLELKAAQEVKLEGGTDLNLKAGASFKAEGSAGAEVSTSAVAVLKGSLVQIN